VIGVLDESFSLGSSHSHEEFALGKFSVWSEEGSKSILISIEGESLNEEFKFTIVLVSDGSGILSGSWGSNGSLWLGIRTRVRVRSRSGGAVSFLGGFLDWLSRFF